MQSPYAEPLSLLMAGDVADVGLPDDCGPLAHTCTSAVSLGYHGYIKTNDSYPVGRWSSARRGPGRNAFWKRDATGTRNTQNGRRTRRKTKNEKRIKTTNINQDDIFFSAAVRITIYCTRLWRLIIISITNYCSFSSVRWLRRDRVSRAKITWGKKTTVADGDDNDSLPRCVLHGSAAPCTRTAVIVRRRETDRGRSGSHRSW